MKYQFSGFTFDADTFELSSAAGETIALQPRALELLYFLLRQPRSLARKEDILREVWGGVSVSSGALSLQVFKLREALGDTEAPHQLLQTIKRQGLRLHADVTTPAETPVTPGQAKVLQPADTQTPDTLHKGLMGDRPSIAVLPFAVFAQDDHTGGLVHALPLDIIMALSKGRLFQVRSSSTSFLFRPEKLSPVDLRKALDCDYCLSGKIASAGEKLNIYAELINAHDQSVLWANQFETKLSDIHDVRRTTVSQVCSAVEKTVPQNEARRVRLLEPESLTAWQAFHVGTRLLHGRVSENVSRARKHFDRAVRIDPKFARAWAGMAQVEMIDAMASQGAERDQAIVAMREAAERAYEADPIDPSANLVVGWTQEILGKNQEALDWGLRAVELAPSYAYAHHHIGVQHAYAEEAEKAIERISTALRLNPRGPERFSCYRDLSVANFMKGDVESAIEMGCKAGEAPYDELQMLLVALGANHLKGDHAKAKSIAGRIRETFPGIVWGEAYGTRMPGKHNQAIIHNVLEQYGLGRSA